MRGFTSISESYKNNPQGLTALMNRFLTPLTNAILNRKGTIDKYMYDGLTMWDLSSVDKPSVMIPGLATEWKVNDDDKKKWIFKLRPGVTFHDGSPFNADAVVWNVEKVLKQDAPQFDASQVGVTASRMIRKSGNRFPTR